MRKSTVSALLFSLLLAAGACAADLEGGPVADTGSGNGSGNGSGSGDGSGNGGGTGDDPGDTPPGDTPDDTPPGETATVCLASSELTTIAGESEGFVGFQDGTTGPQFIDVYVPVTQGDGDHYLNLSLWDGFGVLAGGLQPGTYQLAGDELDLSSCGACVLVGSQATESELLMATGGTVTISAVSTTVGSQFTASVSNLSFSQFRVDPATETVSEVTGGCQASMASAQIAATIEVLAP